MVELKFSYEEFVVALFIGPIILVVILNVIFFLIVKIKSFYSRYKDQAIFERKMEELERRKREEGFLHKWVTVKSLAFGELMVCEESGFCPKLYGFFEVEWVKKQIEMENKGQKVEADRKDFFDVRLKELSENYKIDLEDMRSLSEKILNINKEFTLKKLEDLKNELKPEDL